MERNRKRVNLADGGSELEGNWDDLVELDVKQVLKKNRLKLSINWFDSDEMKLAG